MPAYNFQTRFVEAIKTGFKRTTIRANEAVPGTTAYLFTGMRTKACKRIGQGRIIGCSSITVGVKQSGVPLIVIRGKTLNANDLALLAKGEGFKDALELVDFFKTTYKTVLGTADGGAQYFKGYLIAWDPDKHVAWDAGAIGATS